MIQPKRELTPLDQDRDFATRWNVKVWPIVGGEPETMELQFTWAQFQEWQAGAKIQTALGHLPPEQREFLMSGITSEAWIKMFPPKPKWHASITPERIMASVERRHATLDNPGFCIACGADAMDCEPDACEYECASCGEPQVYADEELLTEIAT